MSRDLATLRKWAGSMATSDPDEAARPLWRQIEADVSSYLDADAPVAPGPSDVPLLGLEA